MKLGFCIVALLCAGIGQGATFVVTNAANSGEGTLRAAITNANVLLGPDTITFNIGGGGFRQITVTSALPSVVDAALLDGTTQPGYSNQPLIQVVHAATGFVSGLTLAGSGAHRIVAMGFHGFTNGSGLRVNAHSNRIERCLITSNDVGVLISGGVWAGNRIGGAGLGNTIHGSWQFDIQIQSARGTVVQGNLLGTLADGLSAPTNQSEGISLQGATNNLVGGLGAGEGNVISGHMFGGSAAGHGIELTAASMSNRVEGNLIGLGLDGSTIVSNRGSGIHIDSPGNVITRNVISANGAGIELASTGTVGTVIQGNLIGLDASGLLPRGNRARGILINGGNGVLVGGTNAGSGNVIAFNAGAGVFVTTNSITGSGIGNSILGNLIYSNTSIFIDLSPPFAATTNDPAPDVDGGANNLQNFPVVVGAQQGTFVQGLLVSAPSQTYRCEFFAAGVPQGMIFLGATNLTTPASGTNVFNIQLSGVPPLGAGVFGTATDAAGNTSELGTSAPVTAAPDLDSDGLWDSWEIANLGSTAFNGTGDNDADGLNNYAEFVADTSPTNATSYFRMTAISNGPPRYPVWNSSRARWYDLDYSTNLLSPVWLNLASNLPGAGGPQTVPDPDVPASRSYRVRAKLP